jgi:hypothetical protein
MLAGLIVAFLFIMGLAAPSAHAGVAVAPLKQEISLKPGEESKVTLTLAYINRMDSDVQQKLKATLVDVQATESGSLVFKDPGALKTSASKWVTINDADVTLDPGQSKSLECIIKVPFSAAPGEYYAAVMVSLAQKGVDEKGVTIQYRIASGIFVTVLGREFPKEAKLASCELIWPNSTAAAPSTQPGEDPAEVRSETPSIRVVLQNTGQARFDGSGKITILDQQSKLVLSSAFVTKRATVFGGDTRLFEAPINKALPAGSYTIKVEMDYESAWAKARQEMHVEILPAQAELLAQIKKKQHNETQFLELSSAAVSASLPSGATRTIAIAVKDIAEGNLTCSAATGETTSGAESWFNVSAESFTLTKGMKRNVVLKVAIPAGAKPGKYSSTVVFLASAGADGNSQSQITLPVEIDVKAGR